MQGTRNVGRWVAGFCTPVSQGNGIRRIRSAVACLLPLWHGEYPSSYHHFESGTWWKKDSAQPWAQTFPGSHWPYSWEWQEKKRKWYWCCQTIYILFFCPVKGNHGFHGIWGLSERWECIRQAWWKGSEGNPFFSEIESLFKSGYRERTRCRQLRSILKKYRDVSSNKEELQKELKTKFGIDIVFFGKKDAPYGYMLVDHANKTVIHGARVLAVEELLDFTTPEERFNRIEDYIDRLLTLIRRLPRVKYTVKSGSSVPISRKVSSILMTKAVRWKPFMAEAIDRNNRIAMVEMFSPANEAERDVCLQNLQGFWTDLVDISPERTNYYTDAVNRLREIFNDETVSSVRSQLHEEGLYYPSGKDATAINFKQHIIINLTEETSILNS